MKQIIFVLALLTFTFRLPAQTDEPARLALLADSSEASAVSDVLTAQLSSNAKVHLLERNEIEKVYREQGFTAENKDDLKLGQILGADGLMLLDVNKTKEATNLTVRLVAVKPGVVLLTEKFPWPLANMTEWAPLFGNHLDPLLPKLTLLVKDAIPISVVNLRCAAPSDEAAEVERQLRLLTIERLSQERRFFVLERQRMQLLGEEKELKFDGSAFWNGSYLLEGVVDQNGRAKDTITINARLTPPKGGAPLLMEVSGNRANFAEVINRLAAKVDEALKIISTAPEWNAAEEATQFFNEGTWALQWDSLPEAQAAAESAWALGKHDVDCAMLRVKAYTRAVPSVVAPGFEQSLNGKRTHYVHINEPPDPKYCDIALYGLRRYYEFVRNSPEGEPFVLSRGKGGSDWHDSDCYLSGINALVVASGVLQHFNYVPASQKPVADKLAELRASARLVAELISKSPLVHDSYFVGGRIVTHDELGRTMQEKPNIFRCIVNWGCYWQEKPEDTIALYRELMSSPVFCYLHQDLWLRPEERPRLIAWNEDDRRRIPALWNDFCRELKSSPDIQLQLEAKALAFADADSDQKLGDAFTNFFNSLMENREALLTNNVEVVYLAWGADALASAKIGAGVVTHLKESLENLYHLEFRPKLEAMDKEYWAKTLPALRLASVFQRQKQYLQENKPYDFMEFVHLFNSSPYSKAQALEIQPMIAAYKSNLVEQSKNVSGLERGKLMGAIAQIGFLEHRVNGILNPTAPKSQQLSPTQTPMPVTVAKMPTDAPASINTQEIVTNVLTVGKFLEIPMNGLQSNGFAGVIITGHRWVDGKLLLDLRYGAFINSFDANGKWAGTRNATYPGIAILNPKTEEWNVVGCPEVEIILQSRFYHRSTLWRGELFTCDGNQIKKYDFTTRQWKVLEISDGNNYELFTVNDHLYAANKNTVFEITDGGKTTRLLASGRRQPPVSVLDSQDLGTPTLFEGPGHSLRIATSHKIYTWMDNDWHEDADAPPSSSPTAIFDDGVLFVTGESFGEPARISRLATASNAIELCLEQKGRPTSMMNFSQPVTATPHSHKPTWDLPSIFSHPRLPVASHQSDLYLLVDHSEGQNIVNEQQHLIVGRKVVAKGGYHAELLCFSPDVAAPQKVYLKFDNPNGCPPAAGSPAWMLSADGYLFFGLDTPSIGFAPVDEPTQDGYKVGVWLMPVSQLEPAIAAEKQAQRAQMAQAVAAKEQARKNLLAKYDLKHTGVLDAEEKEMALDDPAFIESELDVIDANHNSRLDPDELAYFDANNNKILDPKEQAGIEIAQHLFAARLLKKFDVNGNGYLNNAEYNDLLSQSGLEGNARRMPGGNRGGQPYLGPGQNRTGHVNLEQIESFLALQLRRGLGPRRASRAAYPGQIGTDPSKPIAIDPRQLFKEAVETYWQNPGGVSGEPPK